MSTTAAARGNWDWRIRTLKGSIPGALRAPVKGRIRRLIPQHLPPYLQEFGAVPSHFKCLVRTVLPQSDFEHLPDPLESTGSGYEHPLGIDEPDGLVEGVIRVHVTF